MASQQFLETVLAAPDEPAMRRLVEERAALVAAARSLDAACPRASRPVSREQHRSEPTERVLDGAGFARAIS
jgi:hypothetical protein